MQKLKHIDHSQAKLSFQCTRPHLLKDSIYYLYLLQDSIYICQSWECQDPKYSVEINLSNRLYWTFDKDRCLKSFGIEYRNCVKYLSAKEQFIQELKRMTTPLIMFKEVSDFYQPIKMIAKGGQSKVYTVQDRKTGEIVISKCVDKRYLEEDGGAQGLFNEIQLMQQLQHDTIMKIKEVYEGENTYYMIMDYLKGPSLHEITLRGNLNIDQIRKILLQIVQGIAYLHSKRVMHRDLKPENIMFRDKESVNHVRICDFGLATSIDVPKLPFPKCGTPGYVAPEIANLKDDKTRYGLACDILVQVAYFIG